MSCISPGDRVHEEGHLTENLNLIKAFQFSASGSSFAAAPSPGHRSTGSTPSQANKENEGDAQTYYELFARHATSSHTKLKNTGPFWSSIQAVDLTNKIWTPSSVADRLILAESTTSFKTSTSLTQIHQFEDPVPNRPSPPAFSKLNCNIDPLGSEIAGLELHSNADSSLGTTGPKPENPILSKRRKRNHRLTLPLQDVILNSHLARVRASDIKLKSTNSTLRSSAKSDRENVPPSTGQLSGLKQIRRPRELSPIEGAVIRVFLASFKSGAEEHDWRACLRTELPSLDLTGQVSKIERCPAVTDGGFSDVWAGIAKNQIVAIKSIRCSLSSDDKKLVKRTLRELVIWSRVDHPNVLPLIGYSFDFGRFVSLISPWQVFGKASSYLRRVPKTTALKIIVGAASGLKYLHDRQIIHGDFRGDNILISASESAVVADYGLSAMITSTGGLATSSAPCGNVAWMAPELHEPDANHTMESDVWSYGMTVLELWSGRRPYDRYKTPISIIVAHMRGIRPDVPSDFPETLMNLCARCWCMPPKDRPTMEKIQLALDQFSFPMSVSGNKA